VVDCEPTSARVTIDGESRGTVAETAAAGGLALPRGLHRIEISADQHGTFRLELNLGAKTERIQVKLIRNKP
jgi:hypothetical protein